MSKKTKTILIVGIASIIIFIIVGFFGMYTIYKIGEKKGLLEETPSTFLKEEYLEQKQMLDQQEDALELEEDELERKYVNREITYEEYKQKKQEIDAKEDALERQEDELERKYGVDD